MNGGIYLIQDGGQLVEMSEQAYDSEDLLQELLAKYPHLLAGDQLDNASPRRWLLVMREAGVPGDEGAGARWSVDHLFLDQDAIPTLVEVKRSTDTREGSGSRPTSASPARRIALDALRSPIDTEPARDYPARYGVKTMPSKCLLPAMFTDEIMAVLDVLPHGQNPREFYGATTVGLAVRRLILRGKCPSLPRRLMDRLAVMLGLMDVDTRASHGLILAAEYPVLVPLIDTVRQHVHDLSRELDGAL